MPNRRLALPATLAALIATCGAQMASGDDDGKGRERIRPMLIGGSLGGMAALVLFIAVSRVLFAYIFTNRAPYTDSAPKRPASGQDMAV